MHHNIICRQNDRLFLACLIFGAVLVLNGCADNDNESSQTATPTPLQVTATPTAPPTATAPPPTVSPTIKPTETPTPANPVLALPVDETISLTGLPGTTDVAFDSLGIPHVFAPDRPSALFVQGYETARVRFWEMDAFRRVAEGRLSELFGGATFNLDATMRTVFTTRDGRRIEEALWEHLQETDPKAAALGQAYADGINAWLADLRARRNGATLPPEYTMALINLGPADLAEWRVQDSLAIARLQAWDLSESLSEEISRAEKISALPDAVFRDVFRSAPATPATVLPVEQTTSPRPHPRGIASQLPSLPSRAILHRARVMLERAERSNPFGNRMSGVGSNNWIIAPQHSASGHALLANDPHLALFNPPIWHMIQLDAGDALRVNGVIFPGLPGVILGHNDHGAWGGTVAVFDVTDVYTETVTTPPDYPASPRTVHFNGEEIPVLRVIEPIVIKGGSPIDLVIEVVPHHGPMVPDPDPFDDVVGLAATNMSFRWTGHEITNDFRFLMDLNQARNVSEFKAALRNFAVGAQNWIWADTDGNIAYFPRALVPQRPPGTIPYLPMPGTGEAEWLRDEAGNTLWLPEEKLPQAVNPPEGFLATANNDQIGNTLDNDPLNDEIYLTYATDLGFREQRVQNLLLNKMAESGKLSIPDLSEIQYDTSSSEAGRLLPFLFAAAENRGDLVTAAERDALDRLRAWGEAKAGSAAWEMASGVDPADERRDVAPRTEPVSAEERSDAVAASIYAAWITRLGRDTFADDFEGTGVSTPGSQDATKALLHILEDVDRTDPGFVVHTLGENGESSLWNDKKTPTMESRDDVLLAALAEGLDFLAQKFGSDNPADWLWGKVHQVLFQHFFGQAGLSVADLGTFAAPGGRWTVNPANYSLNSDNFVFSGGPSMRFVTDLDPNGIHAVNILPGGNNGNPGDLASYNTINPDIHYGDHVSGWINGNTFELRVSREAVAADTQRHIRYTTPDAQP